MARKGFVTILFVLVLTGLSVGSTLGNEWAAGTPILAFEASVADDGGR